MTALSIGIEGEFCSAHVDAQRWNALLQRTAQRSVFLTRQWLETWWQSFGRGRLMLVTAERDGELLTLAPLFADSGMVFFVGSGGSDYLDFLGEVDASSTLADMLAAARDATADFVGFRFYHIPEDSPTAAALNAAAAALGLVCVDEGSLDAPRLDMVAEPERANAALKKKSLVRHERYFKNNGGLSVRHLRSGADIQPLLPHFYEQHVARWAGTAHPSLFNDPVQRDFYCKLTEAMDESGWLRFTYLEWCGRPIAFHFGFCYERAFLWYKPSFDVGLAKRSPGEALLRQLLLAARDEHAAVFDFGLGAEPFKSRFATEVRRVRTWGLYPPEALGQ